MEVSLEPSDSDPKPWKPPPKLSYGQHKKYPHLSRAVDVKFSKAEGRYMVAKQKISPGDVLMVDRPYITSLFRPFSQSHCNLCFKRLQELINFTSILDNPIKFLIQPQGKLNVLNPIPAASFPA